MSSKLGFALSVAVVLGQTASLTDYCAALATQCPDYGFNATICIAAFNSTTVGTLSDTDTNSIGCRQKFLGANASCAYAGITGGGRCGDLTAGVCQVAVNVCGSAQEAAYTTVPSCIAGLSAIAGQWGSLYGPASAAEDSLECRAYHAVASLTGGSFHCAHFTASTTANLPCIGPVTVSATRYCEDLQYQCKAPNAQFGDIDQCLKVAASYPTSAADDARRTSGHTLGCRQYHARASQSLPGTHCQHAGPSGGGVCGSAREAWGTMFAASPCNNSHVQTFLGFYSNSTIPDALVPSGFSATTPYSVTFDTNQNTQACRIYHLSVAATSPVTHCIHGSVSGGGACGTYVPNLCYLIGQACGFGGNASYQFSSSTACTTALADITPGSNQITLGTNQDWASTNNTLECRFYHASVAASFAPGGVNSVTPNAMASQILHCSHVLQRSTPGGCGAAGPTPSMTGNMTTNAAVTSGLSLFAISIVVYIL